MRQIKSKMISQVNNMAEISEPITTDTMLFFHDNNLYEVVVEDISQPFFLSFLFEIEKQKKVIIADEFMTKNGISITEKPVDEFIDKILENL